MTSMTMITSPKALVDPHISMIQRNAIASWKQLNGVQVILVGAAAGVAATAADLCVAHTGAVATSSSGTPLISSMVEIARQKARGGLICIVNCDMVLMDDLVRSADKLVGLSRRFVAIGRRWDLDVSAPIQYGPGWQQRLRTEVLRSGALHPPSGSDYFLFPADCYPQIPPFAVGRGGWDNWMIYEARRQGMQVVDLTESVLAVHQNHDYRHLPGGQSHYRHPETRENTRLAGGRLNTRYTILDATHILSDGRLGRPRFSWPRFARHWELLARRALFFLPAAWQDWLAMPRAAWKRSFGRSE